MKKILIISLLVFIILACYSNTIVHAANTSSNQYNITREFFFIDEYDYDNFDYYYLYTCTDKNGKVIWTYQTETGHQQYIPEVDDEWWTVQTIKEDEIIKDRIYLYENGTIKVLNQKNGKILWKNTSLKNVPYLYCSFFDENQTLYILFPGNLTIIDSKGKTKAQIKHKYLNNLTGEIFDFEFLNNNYLLIYGMDEEGTRKKLYIDLNDFTTNTALPIEVLIIPPSQTEYEVGEKLNLDGLRITAVYPNNKVEEITKGYTVTGYNKNKEGIQTITISCKGFSRTYKVKVGNISDNVDFNEIEKLPQTGDFFDLKDGLYVLFVLLSLSLIYIACKSRKCEKTEK